jgi:hypothetical protein
MYEPPAEFRLPPHASRQRQQQWWWQMYDWLADQLDRQNIAGVRAANAKRWRPKVRKLTPEEKIIADARRRRDAEPVRQLYPQIVDFIFPPKGKQGRRKDKNTDFAPRKIAYDFAFRIRELWQEEYGRHKRPRDDRDISAEAFAAAICREWFDCSLTTDDLLDYKPSGKYKSRAN